MSPPPYPVDLQVHSSRSDGTDSPAQLVTKAAALGVQVLALTDHDSVLGVEEAIAAGAAQGVRILAGIEFSTILEPDRDFLDVNILGYGFRHTDPDLLSQLQRVIDARLEQKIAQVERMQAYGLHVPLDEVLALARGVPGRPHIAQIALKHNPDRFDSLDDVFRQYLASNSENSTLVARSFGLRVEDAIHLVHAAGGIAVLAHPGSYQRIRDLPGAIQRMIDAGLDGIEVCYPYAPNRIHPSLPKDSARIAAHFRAFAQERNLLITGGSDYHGKRKPQPLAAAGLTLAEWQRLCQATGWEASP